MGWLGRNVVKILAESIDYSRQGQLAAQALMLPPASRLSTRPGEPVLGCHPRGRTPDRGGWDAAVTPALVPDGLAA